jgi:hypothetical protein
MKIALLAMLGLAAGAVFYHIPRWVDIYANHSLPAPWPGPRYRHWKNGVEITRGDRPADA